MLSLAWTLTRAGGWSRAALLASCTAVVSGLLLVAAALLHLRGEAETGLASVVADSGTRGGVVLSVALSTVAPLLLLNQVVRLGTASRSRRLAALRVAGATSSEVRRLGGVEVGIPTSVGAVAGFAVYLALQALLSSGSLALVPRSLPPWWLSLPIIVGVSGLGFAVGALTSIASPFGVVRRQRRKAPRPWGLLLIVLAVPLTVLGFKVGHAGDVLVFASVALVVLAMIALAPWVAFSMATRAASKASDVPALLAAQRIIAEPGAAGRAAAGIGGIALVGGGLASFVSDILSHDRGGDSFHLVNAGIVSIILVIALFVVSGSMAVHSVESLIDRRREVAFLTATGMPTGDLERTQRRELAIVALPLAAVGSLFGATIVGGVAQVAGEWSGQYVLSALAGVGVTVLLAWLATRITVRLVRPWARQAAMPGNLRTE